MGYSYRCSIRRKCGARRSLKHPIDWYKHRPKCKECEQDTLKSVNDKQVERERKRVCTCRGNGWVHSKGKIIDADRTCIHAKIEDVQLVEELEFLGGGQISNMKETDDCPF